jgi:hypothetical protein
MTIGQASSFLPDYSKAQHSAGLIFKVLETIPSIDVYSPKGTYLVKDVMLVKLNQINMLKDSIESDKPRMREKLNKRSMGVGHCWKLNNT